MKDHIGAVDDLEESRLMVAAAGGYASSVRNLLDNGADPKCRDGSESTALHHAARHGQVKSGLELLRNDGSMLAYKDENGGGAICVAVSGGELSLAE